MTTVADVLASLSETIRPETAARWDPVGLQIGDPDAEVALIGVCHEVTEDLVMDIEATPVDLLITYHPLLFAPVNRLLDGRSPVARAMRLLRAGVNVVVAHTDFDAAPGGAADSLADALGLTDPVPFGADEEEGLPDIGRVGGYRGSLGDLAELVARTLGSSSQRVSGDTSHAVSRVAVVPGSGSDLVVEASQLADALITGDVGHHKAVAALDAGLSVIDPGHIATERPGLASLVAMTRSLTGVEVVDLTHLDPQTWV
ncbi:MAG: Nif3-like dinuclear metal center hexameric protein [Acidimicrobiia bacterium]